MERFDAIIIGAGAAGMFCSALAGQAGRRVLLIDNGKKPGRKILMSGGGRCNFTNLYVEPGAYLSQNPHFCKSALARFTSFRSSRITRKRLSISRAERELVGSSKAIILALRASALAISTICH